MGENRIQEKIELLNDLNIGSEKYNHFYEEILFDLIRSIELYSIIRKNNSVNKWSDIFCGLNNENIPSAWVFTEESIAKEFTTHYKMIENRQYLYGKVTVEELTVFAFNAMFSGVSKFIIDEGRNTLVTNIYDFVNVSLASVNKPPILEKKNIQLWTLLIK